MCIQGPCPSWFPCLIPSTPALYLPDIIAAHTDYPLPSFPSHLFLCVCFCLEVVLSSPPAFLCYFVHSLWDNLTLLICIIPPLYCPSLCLLLFYMCVPCATHQAGLYNRLTTPTPTMDLVTPTSVPCLCIHSLFFFPPPHPFPIIPVNPKHLLNACLPGVVCFCPMPLPACPCTLPARIPPSPLCPVGLCLGDLLRQFCALTHHLVPYIVLVLGVDLTLILFLPLPCALFLFWVGDRTTAYLPHACRRQMPALPAQPFSLPALVTVQPLPAPLYYPHLACACLPACLADLPFCAHFCVLRAHFAFMPLPRATRTSRMARCAVVFAFATAFPATVPLFTLLGTFTHTPLHRLPHAPGPTAAPFYRAVVPHRCPDVPYFNASPFVALPCVVAPLPPHTTAGCVTLCAHFLPLLTGYFTYTFNLPPPFTLPPRVAAIIATVYAHIVSTTTPPPRPALFTRAAFASLHTLRAGARTC